MFMLLSLKTLNFVIHLSLQHQKQQGFFLIWRSDIPGSKKAVQLSCHTNLRKDGLQSFEFADLGPAVLGSSFCILKYLLTEMAS